MYNSTKDTIVATKAKPRLQTSKDNLASPNSVRVWRESPESVALQLRLNNRYVTVSLSFEEAKQVRTALHDAIPA
jgi:hypothetical protein